MNINFESILLNKSIITFLAVEIGLLVVYFVFKRSIIKSLLPIDNQRRLVNNSKVLVFLLTIIIAVSIWHSEIYTMGISLAAFAAALAIGSKELLLCFAGSFYITGARPFVTGDRIEIDDIRGDIIEVGLMSTQILEVGPGDLTHQYTGRTICIPNSTFLQSSIFNETYSDEFVLHVFKLQITKDASWETHRSILLDVANEVCKEHIQSATTHFEQLARKRQLVTPIIEPQVNVKIDSPNSLTLVVRVAVPARGRGKLEQEITRNYLRKVLQKEG